MVLVDTSVWIDFFSSHPRAQSRLLPQLIETHQVVICSVIVAEVLSGEMSDKVRTIVEQSLHSLTVIDLDWNSSSIWKEVVSIAWEARKKGWKVPGLIDRMLILAALKHSVLIWTYDHKLKELFQHYRLNFESMR